MNRNQVLIENQRILAVILDNDEQLINNMQEYFKKKNIKITNLTSIEKNALPDILIVDIAVLDRIQEKFLYNFYIHTKCKHIPKIFLTIKGLPEDRIQGYNSGCDIYLSKPFHPGELEAIIYNLVNQTKSKVAWILDSYLQLKKMRLSILNRGYNSPVFQIQISNAEKEILKKVVKKQTNLQISKELNLTKRNVEKHVSRLLDKVNMNVRADLYQLQ